jgi:hypothetical protein
LAKGIFFLAIESQHEDQKLIQQFCFSANKAAIFPLETAQTNAQLLEHFSTTRVSSGKQGIHGDTSLHFQACLLHGPCSTIVKR